MRIRLFTFSAVLLLVFTACNENNNKMTSQKEELSAPNESETIYTLSDFFSLADSLISDTVKVRGIIDHVCKHSAKRFKMIDEEGKNVIKVELKKELSVFSPENIGRKVVAAGKVIPTKLFWEDINKWEKQVNENHKDGIEPEHYEEEIKLIHDIKDEITSGKITHHTIYHLEAISYDILAE